MVKHLHKNEIILYILYDIYHQIQIFTKYILSQETEKVNTCFGNCSGKKSSFAKSAGMHPRAIRDWLSGGIRYSAPPPESLPYINVHISVYRAADGCQLTMDN